MQGMTASSDCLPTRPLSLLLLDVQIELDIEPDYTVRDALVDGRMSDPRSEADEHRCPMRHSDRANQGARRGEGGHPASATTSDLGRKADVSARAALGLPCAR